MRLTSAIKLDKPTDYLDALQDMESAVKYVKSQYESSKIILWGSSYSASLVIKLAGDNPTLINGVLAFSPGEYFDRSKTYIKDSAKNVKCPVFITSALKEEKAWEKMFMQSHLNTNILFYQKHRATTDLVHYGRNFTIAKIIGKP